jgi:alkylhydroperoxidase family enzyme
VKLTRDQGEMTPEDLDRLRGHGLDDRAIHDATQVIAYFNYISRIADGLGVEPESFILSWGED